MQVFFPYIIKNVKRASIVTRGPQQTSAPVKLVYTLWNTVVSFLHVLDQQMPFIKKWHLTLFYLTGAYATVAHRVTGVRHMLLRHEESNINYRMLGLFLCVQIFISFLQNLSDLYDARTRVQEEETLRLALEQELADNAKLTEEEKAEKRERMVKTNAELRIRDGDYLDTNPDDDEEEVDEEDENSKCVLCYEPRKNATVTECGHLFCWHCIAECLTVKPECPLCRASCLPQQLVMLYHYKKDPA